MGPEYNESQSNRNGLPFSHSMSSVRNPYSRVVLSFVWESQNTLNQRYRDLRLLNSRSNDHPSWNFFCLVLVWKGLWQRIQSKRDSFCRTFHLPLNSFTTVERVLSSSTNVGTRDDHLNSPGPLPHQVHGTMSRVYIDDEKIDQFLDLESYWFYSLRHIKLSSKQFVL